MGSKTWHEPYRYQGRRVHGHGNRATKKADWLVAATTTSSARRCSYPGCSIVAWFGNWQRPTPSKDDSYCSGRKKELKFDARMRAPSVRLLPGYRLRPEESEWALKLRLSISAIRRDGRTCTLGLQPYRRRASPSCQPATTEAILGKASVASRRQRSLTNSE